MQSVAVSDDLEVAHQLTREDFAELAKRGIRTIVNNRPDGEESGQISAAEGARLAAEHGMAYHHIPMTMGSLSDEDIRQFAAALEGGGPAVAHCRSGTRSAILYVLSEVRAGRMRPDEIVAFGQARGLDLRGALAWLQQQGA